MTTTLTRWDTFEPIKNPKGQPAPQNVGGRWVITAPYQRGYGASIVLILFMLVWGGLPSFWLLGAGFSLQQVTNPFNWVPLLFFVIAVGVIGGSLRSLYLAFKERRLDKAQLTLPQAAAYLGERQRFEFERRLKSGRNLSENGTLSARLRYTEVTERTVGTDTTYDHTVLWEHEFHPVTVYSGSEWLRADWTLDLPAHLPPAQIGPKHWLVWHFQVLQDLPGIARTTSDFMIPVMPSPNPTTSDTTATTKERELSVQEWLNQL